MFRLRWNQSSSQKDREWLQKFQTMLRPMVRNKDYLGVGRYRDQHRVRYGGRMGGGKDPVQKFEIFRFPEGNRFDAPELNLVKFQQRYQKSHRPVILAIIHNCLVMK
jgi:hypothetical protein